MEKRKVKYLELKAAATQKEKRERGRGGSFRCGSDDLYALLYCDATNEHEREGMYVARKYRMVIFVPDS